MRRVMASLTGRLAFVVLALGLCAVAAPGQRTAFQLEINPRASWRGDGTARLVAAPANPLTGLPVADPSVLNRRPMLVKVSNESNVIRPQSGLSFADHVWEYQLEGFEQTRYAAVFYSQTPRRIGSVRSTRLVDVEHLVPMYGAILVTSGGSSNRADPSGPARIEEMLKAQPWARRVVATTLIGDQAFDAPYLTRIPNLPRRGVPRYHSLFAFPAAIWAYMDAQGLDQRPNLDGPAFDDNAPAGGVPATAVSLDYPGRGPRHVWRYDARSRRWLSWTEDQNTKRRSLLRDYDLLTWKQLTFDNVVIVYAEHSEANFLEDEQAGLLSVGANLMGEGKAVLLRDGQRYEATWRRGESEKLMQFFDANGQRLPFKPGTAWFNLTAANYPGAEIVFQP